MTQTSNRFFDEIARLMNDAAGVASGVRREFDTVVRNQADRILRELDVVKREEFEAVKDMARLAREENEALKARIAALEAKQAAGQGLPRQRLRLESCNGTVSFPAEFSDAVFLSFPRVAAISAREPRPRHPWRHAAAQMAASAAASMAETRTCTMATVKQMKATARRGPARGPPGRSVEPAACRA